MAPIDPNALQARARSAYERGRLLRGLRLVAIVPLLGICAAVPPCRSLALTAPIGVALAALMVAFAWRGGSLGAAVLPGLFAGLVPFVLPVGVMTVGHACAAPGCMDYCFPACCIGGVASGVLLVLWARAEDRGRAFFGAALAIAALTGAMGCAVSGASGIVGMLLATAAIGTPALVRARA